MFDHRPLSEVVEELNRYNEERIEVRGESLRSQQITGVFQSDDPGSFVSFLSDIPGVEIHTDGGGNHVVVLETSSSPVR